MKSNQKGLLAMIFWSLATAFSYYVNSQQGSYELAQAALNTLALTHGGVWVLGVVAIGFVVERRSKLSETQASDISELKLAKKALSESQDLLQKAQQLSTIGHWKLNPANGEVTGSDELFRIFGLKKSEATFEAFVEVVHPDDREHDVAAIQRGLEFGESWDIEHRLICRDGQEKWVHAIGEANTNENGDVIQLVGTVQDITKIKLAEITLHESELWMKSIYNSLDEAVLVVSPDRKMTNVNNAAVEMFGYSAKEVQNSSTELFHVDHQHYLEFGEKINKAFNKGQVASFEFKAKRKNGEIFPTEHTVSLLKNPDGEIKGIVSVVRDITDRKMAEQNFISLAENLQDGVLVNFESRHVFANASVARMMGYEKAEDLIGTTIQDIVHPDELERVLSNVRRRAQGEKIESQYESLFITKKGEKLQVELNASVTTWKGRPAGMVTVRNITERKQAENALRKSEARLNEAQRIAKVGVWELDVTTNELMWSDEIFRIFEIEKDSHNATYEGFLDAIHPEDRDSVNNAYSESLVNQKPYEITHRLLMKDGRVKHVHEKCESYFDQDGKPLRSVGTVHDITERIQTEEKLSHVQAMLEQANKVAMMGAWELNLINNDLTWSDITKEIHEVEQDFKPDIDTALNFYKQGVHRDTITRIVGESMEKGSNWDEELVIVSAKGNEKWVRAMGQAEIKNGVCVRLYGSFQDISERKQAEKELERIFELSPDLVGTGNLEGYFTRINSSFGRILGYDNDEFMEKPFIEFVYEEDVEKTVAALTSAVEGTTNFNVENRYQCKDGSIKWIEWYVLALNQENKFYATGRDITRRKQNENDLEKYRHQLEELVLERTSELEKSLAEKEVLLKEVHHRVKNNMAMVSAFLQLQMTRENADSSMDGLKACESRIRAMSMVHKRLYQSSDFTNIDMNVLINEISDALFREASSENIQVDIQARGIFMEMDTAIPCAMIINELLSNSLKYAFKDGRPGKISIHMEAVASDQYRIRVLDNGIGLPKKVNIDNPDTLGLQLIKVFVGQLNGEVRIYQEDGVVIETIFPAGKNNNDQ